MSPPTHQFVFVLAPAVLAAAGFTAEAEAIRTGATVPDEASARIAHVLSRVHGRAPLWILRRAEELLLPGSTAGDAADLLVTAEGGIPGATQAETEAVAAALPGIWSAIYAADAP